MGTDCGHDIAKYFFSSEEFARVLRLSYWLYVLLAENKHRMNIWKLVRIIVFS